MKTPPLLRYTLLLLLSCAFSQFRIQAENTEGVAEILKLKQAGVAEDTILAYIQNKNLNYGLSANDILSLQAKGIPAKILTAMVTSGPVAVPPATPTQLPGSAPTSVVTQALPTIPSPSSPPTAQPTVIIQPTLVQPAASPDVAYFYQELSPYGRWILTEDGQSCWQPTFVATTPGWRPYWDKGHWLWTDHGWYWASDYPWGWSTFHYGRWRLHPHHGWVWYPDRVWGPAWVTWRSSGEYSGWAPLPPGAIYDAEGGRFFFHGSPVGAEFGFGLTLAHFSFCFTREISASSRQHLRNETELRLVFGRSTPIGHYTANRTVVGGESRVRVFNHGIEPPHNPGFRGRLPEPVHIEELNTPAPGRAHERFNAHSRTLEVYRPKFGGHR